MTDKTSLNGSFDNDLNTHSVRSSVLQAVALFTGLSVCSMSAFADTSVQRANVVSSSPVYETVVYEEPREVCRQERVAYQEPVRESKTAGVVGALIGGALGNAVGNKKSNKRVGAAVGGVLGYTIGRDIGRRHRENQRTAVTYRQQEVCEVVYEEREEQHLLGYDVRYVYAGQTYETRMDRDPGKSLRVRVAVNPA
ncbi:MAG: hypothetical protein ACI883_000655 [Candidatus Azotimanducaceae bacterium]|jgi:uncharacterized protein YcfJ|tara:strand:- start:21 stop:608 length:588 start_codon:yes stop_codon:yes gene_type:complete